MSKTKDQVISDLVEIMLEQDETIEELRQIITRIRHYIDIYEQYIQDGRGNRGDSDTSGAI